MRWVAVDVEEIEEGQQVISIPEVIAAVVVAFVVMQPALVRSHRTTSAAGGAGCFV